MSARSKLGRIDRHLTPKIGSWTGCQGSIDVGDQISAETGQVNGPTSTKSAKTDGLNGGAR
jgi:hypothetical protein